MSQFIKVEGILIPRHVWERYKQEKRTGPVLRPEGVQLAVNREVRRRMQKMAKKARGKLVKGKVVAEQPILVPQRRSESETLDTAALGLYEEFQKNLHPGTVGTLKRFLDRYEGKVLEQAFRAGRPIPRHIIRNALERIWSQGENRRKAHERKINRKLR